MIRLLARIIVQLLATALGLWIASLVIDGFDIDLSGFAASIAFFTLANFILEPLIVSLSFRYLPVFRGGIALVTTFIVLWLTDIFTTGLTIHNISALFLASFIVWLAIVLASIILPLFMFKKILGKNTPPTPTDIPVA